MDRWTNEEINILKNNFGKRSTIYCAFILNKTKEAVRVKAKRLGLKSNIRYKDLFGQTIGDIKILSFVDIVNKHAIWKVKCLLCDKEFNKSAHMIYQITCCRECRLQKPKGKRYNDGKYILYRQYCCWKNSAKRRKIDWFLEFELAKDILEFLNVLLEEQKFICKCTGIELKPDIRNIDDKIIYGNLSLDRINSNIGYTKTNVQFVTKLYNRHKNVLSDTEFYNLCKLIIQFRERN